MDNVVVYTAIFGGYDAIRPPLNVNKNVRYVLFTDRLVKNKVWEVRKVKSTWGHRKTSRYYKILAHKHFPDADYTIWHGGFLQMIKDPVGLLKFLKDNDIAMEPHKERKCIYAEAHTCIQRRLVNPMRAREQMKAYRDDGYPANNGLSSAFLIVRRNTEEIAEFEDFWWEQVDTHTVRDQLSLCYALWKKGLEYDKLPLGAKRSGFYKVHSHARR